MAIILESKKSWNVSTINEEIVKIIVTDETVKIFDLQNTPLSVIININWIEQWEWEQYTISGKQVIFDQDCDYEIWDRIMIRSRY